MAFGADRLDSAAERALGFLGVELGLYELRPGRAAEGTGGHDVAGRCCVPIRPLCPGVLSAALADQFAEDGYRAGETGE